MSAEDKKKDQSKKDTKVTDLLAQEELVSNYFDLNIFRVRKTKPLKRNWSFA